MKTVVVGGQARDLGKTSVVAGLIGALPQWNWTAVKITQFGPGEAARYGGSHSIEEEREPGRGTDSARFLAAGARRALWLRAPAGRLGEAMAAFREAVAGAENLIIESNSILAFLQPDLYLLLLDAGNPDFKPSARNFFERADAYLWLGRDREAPGNKPWFRVSRGSWVTPELVEFVKTRLQEAA